MLLKPRISVITINYNDGEYLEKTIKSVICQDYDAIEFIIIDGGSEDQSLKIAEKYKNNITIMLSEPDDGLYDAMNKGIKLSTGDWVIFMNSGDCFYESSILTQIFSTNRSEQNVIYGDCEVHYDGYSVYKKADIDQGKLWKGMIFSHQSMFTRRRLLNDTSFKYDLFPIASDFNLIFGLSEHERFYYCGKLISTVTAGGLSDVSRIASLIERYKVVRMHLGFSLSHLVYYRFLVFDSYARMIVKKLIPQSIVSSFIRLKSKRM